MSVDLSLCGCIGALEIDVVITSPKGPVAVIGPNGAGKSTLLRWVAGRPLDRTIRSRIVIDGVVLEDHETGRAIVPEDRRVGYVPQGFGLFGHLRVVDNVAFGIGWRGTSRAARRERALEMLDSLGARDLAERRPETLSGGERQKVALARALVREPRLLLLDEPMAALDVSARRRMRRFLAAQLAAHGTPAFVVTHDVRDVRALGATVVALESGRIVQSGTSEDLRAHPATEFVAEFFDAAGD